ncbi:MAG: hypothetical protein ACRC6N_12770 [Plesiomonas sp.]|uniref:hypothetical protein n=1 Tax=Plesiomonas sp. TaxID=2486279 RepID=UPI003F2EBF71
MKLFQVTALFWALMLVGCDYEGKSLLKEECTADANTNYENDISSFKYEGQRAFASLLLRREPVVLVDHNKNKSAHRKLPRVENKVFVFNTRKLPLEIKKLPDIYDQLSENYRASYLVIDHNSGTVRLGIAGIGIGYFESGVYNHDPKRYKELDKM